MNADFINGMEDGMQNLHKQGAFLTVKSGDKVNTMTISWGNIGFMWQMPIFTIMVRKSRYTYELIEKGESFTVSIPYGPGMRSALGVCGTKSGRNTDKVKEAGIAFVPSKEVEAPIVDGCSMYYECRIVGKLPMNEKMLDTEMQKKFYSDNDYHVFYYGQIVTSYEK